MWTPWGPGEVSCVQWRPSIGGPNEVSCIERCPHFRGSIFGTHEQSLLNKEVSIFQVSFKRGSTIVHKLVKR